MPALIFDCDGVLADTERYGHLPAFNATFADEGLDFAWTDSAYAEAVRIGGGKERMRSLLTDEFVGRHGLPTDPGEQDEMIRRWHRRKTDHYTAAVREGRMPARPGIVRIVTEAATAGWSLAVASTSAIESVRAVLEHAVGSDLAQRFGVYAGDMAPAKKPAPDIYQLALDDLAVPPWDAVVIEDSANGMRAALAAEIPCLVTVSAYTADEDFTGAALVTTCLGDEHEDCRVLANPHDLPVPGQPGRITLADLTAVIRGGQPGHAARDTSARK